MAHFLGALSQRLKFQTLAITVIAPRDLALQPNGLKRFAIALGEAAVEVGGPSALAFDRQADELEYVILLPHRAHEHPAMITEGLRQAILRQLGEADITAPNMLSMRVHKLDPASPELANLDEPMSEQTPIAQAPGLPPRGRLGRGPGGGADHSLGRLP